MNQGRFVGVALIIIGVGITVISGLWLAVQASQENVNMGGVILGAGLAFIVVAPLIGFGLYMWIKGGQEAEQESEMQKQRELLDILRSRGEVRVTDMAVEMGVSVDRIQSMVHQLVGLQVFSGYVNWDDGVLFSAEAKNLRDLDQCKKCGGQIKLAGKGVLHCPYCGTEYFLS
ncbi:MAG: hypothetical protein CUN56_07890 [Phototrophicales bacterium]|nr:MAG: hypothetical protein CUN56_07890 [Phototrophicales bacterium]RMG75647.1 MAG: hypothetical protein D6711_06085 [Chloroflexota bacterium]